MIILQKRSPKLLVHVMWPTIHSLKRNSDSYPSNNGPHYRADKEVQQGKQKHVPSKSRKGSSRSMQDI